MPVPVIVLVDCMSTTPTDTEDLDDVDNLCGFLGSCDF